MTNYLPNTAIANTSYLKCSPPKQRIATLGHPQTNLTCSKAVAHKYFPSANIMGEPSFEKAAESVIAYDADQLLVPGAYPKIAHLFMNPELKLVSTFCAPIPALVLLYNSMVRNYASKLFLHPATHSLSYYINIEFFEKIEASSNETAYEQMIQSDEPAACISNELVASEYGQKIIQVLRASQEMAFAIFERSETLFDDFISEDKNHG